MKAFFLALALILSSVSANAQTQDIRLETTQKPNTPTLPVVSVFVLADGSVQRSSFLPISKMLPIVRTMGQLSVEEVDKIDNLIEEARTGEVVTDPVRAFCFAPSQFTMSSTADNQKVFLRSGDICSQVKRNTSPAAATLVTIIQKLFDKYSK